MTLSSVSSVFSSSDNHQHHNQPSTPNIIIVIIITIQTQLYNINFTHLFIKILNSQINYSFPSTISSVGAIHENNNENNNSLTTDLSFTPPHPYTQLNILSTHKNINNNNNNVQNNQRPHFWEVFILIIICDWLLFFFLVFRLKFEYLWMEQLL